MIRVSVALIASLIVAQPIAGAQSVLKPGIYSGRATCSSSAYGKSKMYWKWRVTPDGNWGDVFDTAGWGADFVSSTATSHSYSTWYNIYGLIPGAFGSMMDTDQYESFSSTITIATNGAASLVVSGVNGPEGTHSGRCSARLTWSPAANNFSLSSDGGRFTSKCYNILPRASMYYVFNDTGGFMASMTMYAKPCGRGSRRRLIDFKKWVETYGKDAVVKLPAGRYRFEGFSTGYWTAESMMGLSR